MRLIWFAVCLVILFLATVVSGKSGNYSYSSSSWSSRSSSPGYRSSRPSTTGHGSSSRPSSGRITKPKSSPTQHVNPSKPSSKISLKPTSRPQIYDRNTPRPIIHAKPTGNKVQQQHVTNTQSSKRHNTTLGGGGAHHSTSHVNPSPIRSKTTSKPTVKPTLKPQVHVRNTPRPIKHTEPKVQQQNVTNTQSGKRHNTTSAGGGIRHINPWPTTSRTISKPPVKPTSIPQVHVRNTPRPIVHPKPKDTKVQQQQVTNTQSGKRHNTTSGEGGAHHSAHPWPTTSRTISKPTVKPTSIPQVHVRNTPRPIVHPKPTDSKVQQQHDTNTQSGKQHNTTSGGGTIHHSSGRHNNTAGGISHLPGPILLPKPTDSKVQQQHFTNTQSGKLNTTLGGGDVHHSSGRHNNTGGTLFPSAPPLPGHGLNPHAPSAPPLPGHGLNPHAPSAPPLPGGSIHPPGPGVGGHQPGFIKDNINKQHVPDVQNQYPGSAPPLPGTVIHPGSHQPPTPGWHPEVTQDAVNKQHIPGVNNPYPGQNPPPYPGYHPAAPPPYPGNNQPYPNHPSPPYPGAHYPGSNQPYPNHPPPPYPGAHYPGTNNPYPNQPLPLYPGQNVPPIYPGGAHYPIQQGGPVYHPHYYPAPPPPPPGFNPYGVPYYNTKVSGNDEVAGLVLWELTKNRHHHHYGIRHVHHHHYHDGNNQKTNSDSTTNYQPTYHDTMRERYTTRITPSTNRKPNEQGAYNILEMTHYITPNDEGVISSSEGNMTCVSVYNAKSVSSWHQKQVNDFRKQYPNSVFPLYRTENDTKSENFTVVPGRIIHREPVSITCCGTNKGKLDLTLLTNGKHPDVNCVNHLGHIPIKKLTFVRTEEIMLITNTSGWHKVNLTDINVTTPTPLAPYPSNSSNNVSTPTPLPHFPPTFLYTSTESSLVQFSTNVTTTTTAMPVDLSQTFDSLGAKNESVDLTQVFSSLGNTSSTESSVGVTNNPSDLIIG